MKLALYCMVNDEHFCPFLFQNDPDIVLIYAVFKAFFVERRSSN